MARLTHTLQILIVDDNPGERVLYRQLLSEGGMHTCEFTEAGSGRTGLAAIEEKYFDFTVPTVQSAEYMQMELQETAS